MRKTLALLALGIIGCAASVSAQDDPIIMTVAGKPVPRSEFVYSFQKNNGEDVIDRKTVDEYVELFANYKRKVQAALDAHLDTLTSYNKEFRQYRDQQILPTLINEADVEAEARRLYDEENNRIGVNGLYDVSNILMHVKQNDSEEVLKRKQMRADSLYNVLVAGADFETIAKQYSEDPGTASNGGRIGQVARGQLLEKFEAAMIALKPGEFSKPVQTEVGFHIIKLNERKSLAPYDSLRNTIMAYIEKRNIRKALAQNRLKNIAQQRNTTEEAVMDMRSDSISAIDQNMKYLIKEYHDGLLLYEISNREVWEKAAKDEKGLEAFWKKNKKKYTWEEPRFKGIAYYTRNAEDIEAVKNCVMGHDFSEWAPLLRNTFNNDSVLRIRVEKGIFKKGTNGIVDREIFGNSEAKVKEKKDFPYTATYGKVLNAPEEMGDVKALVVADYQEIMEKSWIEELKKRYPITVNKEVLATVK
jgi:peptidyl-prolyl cis-trans isomerase SurA